MAMLKKYWWPGNIRELENLIERLVAVSDKEYISEEDLPLEFHFAQLEPRAAGRRLAVRGGDQYLRAKFPPPGAGKVRLERHRDRRVPWNSAEHAEIQDGQAGRASAGETIARRLTPANNLAVAAKSLSSSANPLISELVNRRRRRWAVRSSWPTGWPHACAASATRLRLQPSRSSEFSNAFSDSLRESCRWNTRCSFIAIKSSTCLVNHSN